ncbi:hypothetical protein JTB14_033276 [Gonioctena quinquepunctata]|nr:hypothetical protein JTB14_033276 [Gonioctena quinquepunctata]
MITTGEEWKNIVRDFETHWNFNHCVGSMDGKHITLQSPFNSGSDYFNYKSFFSIVVFAIADTNYCFVYVNVGCQGRISDGGVFANTHLRKMLDDCALNLPSARSLPGRSVPPPYVFVADDAFPLHTNIMKSFAGLQEKGSKEKGF